MSQTADALPEEMQGLLDEVRRHEEQVRRQFESILEGEAVRQQAEERWPFAGGWHTVQEIRRLRRQAYGRWWAVRIEALLLIALTVACARGVFGALVRILP